MVLEKVSRQKRVSMMDVYARKNEMRGKDGGIKGNFSGKLHFAESSTAAARLKLCRSCENYRIGLCARCGCLVRIKAKIQMASCPAQKW